MYIYMFIYIYIYIYIYNITGIDAAGYQCQCEGPVHVNCNLNKW